LEVKIKLPGGGSVEFNLPWGGVLDIEAHPMEPYKFYNLVWGIVLCVVATSFFAIWT